MTVLNQIAAACALGFFAFCGEGRASNQVSAPVELGKSTLINGQSDANIHLAASVQSLGSRASVAGATQPVYGGFTLSNTTVVYILVRGPSLRTLGVIPNPLDAPWVRLYDGANRDLVATFGTPGGAGCTSTGTLTRLVFDYYQTVRNQPVDSRDTCYALTLAAGVYTFSVTASIPGGTAGNTGVSSSPSAGEILFEVTL